LTAPAEIVILSSSGESPDFVSVGTVTIDSYGVFMEYDESSLSGMDGTVTRIGVSEKVVTVNRMGQYVHTLVFEEGREFSAQLLTPFGSTEITVVPLTVFTQVKDGCIEVNLEYSLVTAGDSSKNSLRILCTY